MLGIAKNRAANGIIIGHKDHTTFGTFKYVIACIVTIRAQNQLTSPFTNMAACGRRAEKSDGGITCLFLIKRLCMNHACAQQSCCNNQRPA
mgnify:CR=1 FL=1